MDIKKVENHPVLVNALGVVVGFIGVIIGAITVGYYQNNLYKYQLLEKKTEKKEQILDQAYRIYAKMNEIRFWQEEAQIPASTVEICNFEKERTPILAKSFSDLLSINKSIILYFGADTEKLVNQTFFNSTYHAEDWWNIPDEQLYAITKSMTEEIKKEIENYQK